MPMMEGQGHQIYFNLASEQSEPERRQLETLKVNPALNSHLIQMNMEGSYQRILGKHQ